ncbi:MAG: sulfatase-like hydrolase/transferase [Cyclobacteriaceae bacterium]|nr:sulfatase-like hydrolase/transferase [Cyclobacteriaceae bacterium]
MTSRFLVFILILWTSCVSSPESNKEQPPNIIFLFADDFTYTAIHALGNDIIQTPNLDKLVNGGVSFTHAYNMGGWHGAICVASRSMIISGTSLWKAKDMETRWMAEEAQAANQTWGKLLGDAGYDTYMSGKWHVQIPAEQVFDVVRHIRPGMPPDYWVGNDTTWRKLSSAFQRGEDVMPMMPLGYNRPLHEQDTSWQAWDPQHGGFWQGGKHWSEVLKDDALDFIEMASTEDQPFFMYLAFNAPHDPRQAPRSFLDLYPLDSVPLPENWLPEYPYKDSIGNTPLLRDEALAPYPRTPLAIKTHIREYYAIISHLDHQIGLILEALEAHGLAEDTYIFFTGDHGLSVGRHGLLGKQNLYDHSIRVPLVMTGPGIPAGKKVDAAVYLQDIMATSLQIAGTEIPSFVDFRSFWDLATGATAHQLWPEGMYGAYVDYQRMISKDGYKLMIYPPVGKVQLFDLKNDPQEMNNLAEVPEYKSKVDSLFQDLLKLQAQMGDELRLNK